MSTHELKYFFLFSNLKFMFSENENGEVSAFTAPKDNPISGVTIDIKKPGQYLINHHDNIDVTTSQYTSNISDTENVITDQSTQPESDDFDSNLSRLSSYQEHQGQSDLITSSSEYSISTEDEDQRNDMNQENKLISIQDQHPMQDKSIDLDFPSVPKGKKKIYEPIYHLAPLVKESLVLSNLVMLGVSLAEIEKQGAADMLVQLNFENDVQPLLLFLKEIDVADADLCRVITKNPFLFKAEIADLKVHLPCL